ncbi:MAG TPA: substrate-binding domain-containing protein [Anaerolineales bacterium]|nr:substrate-binding domain-containing protein [Anaerolineales bacterium]
MDELHLYRQISETIRQEILNGRWKAGDRLPSVREMAEKWDCTVGTIQHAYQELSRQGLVTSRAGQGTKVVENLPALNDTPLRRAMLIHRAEAFLLEVLTGGYSLEEVEQATRQAMDRWRTVERQDAPKNENVLRFSGSHDLALTWLASHFPEIAPGYTLQLNFSGSLGGLIALAEGRADLAGCHLWDEESDEYNLPFVRRLLPGKRMAVVTLANRRLGLILPPGNPGDIHSLADLARPGLRFINRQSGSGTRVWLDISLRRLGIETERIAGYESEKLTHSAVAQAVAENGAEAGIGLEAAALSYGLDFLFLTHERYDLVAPEALMETSPMAALVEWLSTPAARQVIEDLGGYEAGSTGQVEWT